MINKYAAQGLRLLIIYGLHVLYVIYNNIDLVTSLVWSSHTFTRVEWIADESRRTGTPETAFVVVTLGVFAAGRPRTFVHVVTSGAVRIARVPFRTFTVVSARKVCAQRTGTANVRQTTLVYVHTLIIEKGKKNVNTRCYYIDLYYCRRVIFSRTTFEKVVKYVSLLWTPRYSHSM